MGGWVGSRPPTALKLAGKIAEVWSGDAQVGLLYDWSLAGDDGKWQAEASRYCFSVGASWVVVRFFFCVGRDAIELKAEGHLIGEYATDGKTHRAGVKLKGTALAVV